MLGLCKARMRFAFGECGGGVGRLRSIWKEKEQKQDRRGQANMPNDVGYLAQVKCEIGALVEDKGKNVHFCPEQ